jgi:hypothetical protein
MPGFLLHVGAVVTCAHGGQAQPTVSNPRVMVMGTPTVTLASPYMVASCAFPPPSAANGPCVTAKHVTASLRVTSLGVPLLLMDSQAICAPTGTPLLVAATQTHVSAI